MNSHRLLKSARLIRALTSIAMVGLVAIAPTVARAWTHDSQALVLSPKPAWASAVSTMSDGTSFQALNFKGSLALGSVTLTAPSSSDWRWAVVKFDRDGDAVWGTVLPDGTATLHAVAVDSLGNSYVSGSFENTVTIGSTSLSAVGGWDAFVAKLNSAGVVQWARAYGSAQNDWSHGAGVDANGNVFVGGGFKGSMTVGSTTLTSAGDNDLWIAKLNSAGVPQWAKSFGGTGDENGGWSQGLAVDSAGNAYLTGQINSSFTVNGVAYNTTGSLDAVVAKIDSSGNWQWLATGGSTAIDHVYGVAVDGSGDVYVTGQFSGNANWGAISTSHVGSEDGYVAKISAAGTWQWVKRIASTGADYGYGIAVTAAGTVTVTGDFNGATVSVDGETLSRAGSTNADGWVGQWNSSGVKQWAQRFGSDVYDGGFGVGVDADGNAYVSGESDGPGSVTFGSGSAIAHLSGCTADCSSSFLWAISPSGGVPTTTTTTSSTTSTVSSTTTSVVQTSTTVPSTTVSPSNTAQASGATTTTVKATKSVTPTTVGSSGGATSGEAGSATGVVAPTTTASTEPTPSVGDSAAPTITELPLGASSARVGGKTVSTSMKREANKIVLSINGMVATLGGATSNGEPVSLDADGNLRVMPGDKIDLTITGLEPGSSVEGWLFSDPTELGSLDVSSNGEADGSFTVPETVENGQHTFALEMTDSVGQTVEAGLGIAVGELETGSSTTAIALGLLAVATVIAVILPVALRRRRVPG